MPQTNALYSKIEKILKSIPELITEEEELRYNKIKEMAENGDAVLLVPLMKNKEIKKAFFAPVLDSFVFKTKEFKDFLDYSSSNNSWSKNLGKKIGLYMGDSALTDRSEVVLNFPYKDCVLEGGQKKEDGLDTYFEYDQKKKDYVEKTDKRREVFFNEVLAKDEIDSLFSPKAFCNVKRYTEKGAKACTSFERDAELNRKRGLSDDTITDNLIVKGNNLLALHSLKEEFEGKVKLIYIDPPYNTGSDDFKYNDNFNHSSWLTFMKNRLEVARDLLREDGCIFVQCDDNEQAYLKVLMDEVFGRENFVTSIAYQGLDTVKNDAKYFSRNHEFILCFAVRKELLVVNGIKRTEEQNKVYKNPDNDSRGRYLLTPLHAKSGTESGIYKFKFKNGRTWMPPEGTYPRFSKDTLAELEKDNRIYFGKDGKGVPQKKTFLNEVPDYVKLTTFWDYEFGGSTRQSKSEVKILELGFATPKPEKLMSILIDAVTSSLDIVLDYHLGSGTTAAVAHKMNRQYIGVEQMDYIKTISCERLLKVIKGEQGGISKSVNWQGGGSFVYMELAEKNERALKLISACKSYEELVKIFTTLCNKYFLHYNVRVNEFINTICKEPEFKELSLKRQKEIFSRMIDLNQLYVNLDDRKDKDSGLSEKDIQATEDFYQLSKDK